MPQEVVTFLSDLFIKEGLILLIGLYVLGEVIKNTNAIPNNYITVIVPIIGLLVAVICSLTGLAILKDSNVVICGIKGLILGWAATGGYETIRNLKNKETQKEL